MGLDQEDILMLKALLRATEYNIELYEEKCVRLRCMPNQTEEEIRLRLEIIKETIQSWQDRREEIKQTILEKGENHVR